MTASDHLNDGQFSAYIDQALSDNDAAAVAAHLDGCAECGGRLQLLRATTKAVASLPEQELPRPLDFGFLLEGFDGRPGAAGAPSRGSRGFVARVIHGRPPSWLPTMVAAAAVLALVVTWVPRLVPSGGQSHTATGLGHATRAGGGALFSQTTPQFQPGAGVPANPAPGAQAAVPSSALSSAHGAAQKTVVGPDGSTISLLANPPSASTGQPVQLLLRVVGGPRGTDLASPGMEIFAGQGQSQMRLGGSEGTSRTLKSGEELDLTIEWSAGAVTGPPAPGTYSLIGRVFLKNANVVEVALTFTVTS
jgi:anti-sigma factor RsiW